MEVDTFLAQFATLSDEELKYKQLWLEHKLPSIPVGFDQKGNSIADITLWQSRFFLDDKRYFHIEKHGNYLPNYIHNHEFLEIEVVMRGLCVQEMNGNRFTLEEGDVIMISPSQYHAVSVYDDISVVINVLIPRYAFDSLFASFIKGENIFARYVASLGKTKMFAAGLYVHGCQELFPTVVSMYLEGDRSVELGKALISAFIARLALQEADQYQLIEVGSKSDARIGAILHYIQENPDKVSLKTLSYAFGLTSAYMSALIHKMTGSTFGALLTRRRMGMVLQLLEQEPAMTLSQIADAVGYESVQHLCRVFRRCYHLSPTEYRHHVIVMR